MVSGGKTTATTSSSNTTTTSHKPSSSSSSSTSSRSHASSTAAAAKPPLESSDDYSSEEDDVVSASNVRRSYDASYQLVGVSDASLTSSSASISSVTSSLTSSLVLEGGSDTSSSSGGSGSSSTSSKAVRSHGFKHYDRPSLLSSEASANSYRGLINLLVILLVRSIDSTRFEASTSVGGVADCLRARVIVCDELPSRGRECPQVRLAAIDATTTRLASLACNHHHSRYHPHHSMPLHSNQRIKPMH